MGEGVTGSKRKRERLVRAGLVAVWVCVGAAEFAMAQGGERSVPRMDRKAEMRETLSSSGQFLAHGGNQAERAAVVTRAEAVQEEFAALVDRQLRVGESGMLPERADGDKEGMIVIHLWIRKEAQPAISPRLYRVDGVPDPVMGLVLARAELAADENFRREMVRLLLVERVMRGQPQEAVSGRGEILPAWLEVGVVEALDYVRSGRSSDRFAPLLNHGRSLSLEEVLTYSPSRLEAASRRAHAASACCLVLALLEQPDGPDRFRRFLQAMPGRSGSWQDLLVRQFPGLALSRNSLEKWWTLQMAALATPDVFEPMTAAETDQWLEQALVVRHRPDQAAGAQANAPPPVVRWLKNWLPGRGAAESAPDARDSKDSKDARDGKEEELTLDALDRIAALPRRVEILRANQGALAALLLRANPLYRPIIEDYQSVFGQLSRGKTAGQAERCGDLAARRREVLATVEATSDFLNWYEATQRPGLSRSFDAYFKSLEAPAGPSARGHIDDAIARSMDEIEEEFRPSRE